MTIRDLRHHWPEAEKALEVESEIIITRDATPVAKLVRITPEPKHRKRFDAGEHQQWQLKNFGQRPVGIVDEVLSASREDRLPRRA